MNVFNNKNHSTKLDFFIIFLVVVSAIGIWLYQYLQPQCEPCLSNTYCPPCIGKEQLTVLYLLVAFELPISIYIIYLALKK
jgi:hypothetical protein